MRFFALLFDLYHFCARIVYNNNFSSSGTHHTVNYQPAAGGGYIGSFIGTSRIIDSDEAEEITRNVKN